MPIVFTFFANLFVTDRLGEAECSSETGIKARFDQKQNANCRKCNKDSETVSRLKCHLNCLAEELWTNSQKLLEIRNISEGGLYNINNQNGPCLLFAIIFFVFTFPASPKLARA